MIISNKNKAYLGVACILFIALFLYGLGPILTPFVTAALLAYLGDPIADRLEAMKFSRSVSVVIVFIFLSLFMIVCVLLLGPLLSDQVEALVRRMPKWIDRIEVEVKPLLIEWGILADGRISGFQWKELLANYWQESGNFAFNALKGISNSGAALLGLVTNIVLIPVLTFYLLRDFDVIVEKLRGLLPRGSETEVVGITKECDAMLSAFLRGQFIVMITLAVFYSLGLSIVGLELALLIGTVAGLANIIPYMGFVIGILFALLAAWMQFHTWMPLIYVAVIFGVGQLLEGMILTPLLVGDKIGLHPVAVIFALMAGAQLGGFVGLLLALPIAAVLMVLLRHFLKQYKISDIYLDETKTEEGFIDEVFDGENEESLAADLAVPRKREIVYAEVEENSVFDVGIWRKDD